MPPGEMIFFPGLFLVLFPAAKTIKARSRGAVRKMDTVCPDYELTSEQLYLEIHYSTALKVGFCSIAIDPGAVLF